MGRPKGNGLGATLLKLKAKAKKAADAGKKKQKVHCARAARKCFAQVECVRTASPMCTLTCTNC